jgi:hypothetical protein
MKAEQGDGCMCPRCHDRIPEQFYCCNCGYLPDWRQRDSLSSSVVKREVVYKASREAA